MRREWRESRCEVTKGRGLLEDPVARDVEPPCGYLLKGLEHVVDVALRVDAAWNGETQQLGPR